MASGGSRPGAGRPRGSKAVAPIVHQAIQTLKAAPNGSPAFKSAVEYAMHVINDAASPMDAKIRLAVAVMPFQHARLEAKAVGKKEAASDAADAAGDGSDWGEDLKAPESAFI